ncbi:MAG: serine hydrolase [Nitrospiraceae bacterium]|nr:serine hydrolase [Nitrospiraceae bacterium]
MARNNCFFCQGLNRLFEKAFSLFPGAELTVSTGGEVIIDAALGGVTYVPWFPRVHPGTLYDLASLTKPLVTTLSVMVLIEKGLVCLDDTLGDLLPDVPIDKSQISIRHLLSHTSGLPAYRPFYRDLVHFPMGYRSLKMKEMILDIPLESPCGTQTRYSDLGFMLLGWLVEELTGMDLADVARDMVFGPLAATGLSFCPAEGGIDLSSIAPTELCPIRKEIVWGEVNDLNAWALGGVAGHAGLFGSARSVSGLLLRLLHIYMGRDRVPNFSREILQEFWQVCGIDPVSTWALGFDTPSPVGSLAGSHFSPNSIGHLGFTGTSFWMDLEKEVLIVLLTNRTFPRADREKQARMRSFRIELHDLVRRNIE